MSHVVVFSPEAQEQLAALYGYIAAAAAPEVAARYTEAILSQCESLGRFPNRGSIRDDIRLGLRIISYKKRTVIAFAVNEDTVYILGVFYAGRDYEPILRSDLEGDAGQEGF